MKLNFKKFINEKNDKKIINESSKASKDEVEKYLKEFKKKYKNTLKVLENA